MPGREPLCHCGFERIHATAPGRSAPADSRPAARVRRRSAVLAAALVVGVLGLASYAAVRRLDSGVQGAARTPSPRARGEAIYPALPAISAVKTRTFRSAVPPRPPTSAEVDWDRAVALLDLPLRKLAADTSELELSYRRFADPCVAPASGPASIAAGGGDWLASLKTRPVIPGVTIREKGATVDCETARRSLVARADVLKSDLDARERLARTSGVRPEHWRRLMAVYVLDVFDRY